MFRTITTTLNTFHNNSWTLAIVRSNATDNMTKFLEKSKLPFGDVIKDQNKFDNVQ